MNLRLASALFLLSSVEVFADAIFYDSYSGPVSLCQNLTCNQLTQTGPLTFSDGSGAGASFYAGYSGGNGGYVGPSFMPTGVGATVTVGESLNPFSPDISFTGASFITTLSGHYKVTVYGGTGQGYILWGNWMSDPCDGPMDIAICGNLSSSRNTFTFGVPFAMGVNLVTGVNVGRSGQVFNGYQLYAGVYDSNDTPLMNTTLDIEPASTPEPASLGLVSVSILGVISSAAKKKKKT